MRYRCELCGDILTSDIELRHFLQIRKIHLVDGVAVWIALLDPQILVLPVVILDRDRKADRGEAGVQKFGMVAAAAEAVVAPDLHDVEADGEHLWKVRGRRERRWDR